MNIVLHTSHLIGWIGFYSPWLLLWGLGIAIPIAIHFWRRPARQEVPWAAMRFLEEALRVRSKRFQVEQWVLLAIRCFALALLALAVARPFFESNSGSNLGTPSSFLPQNHILVFDNSYSMNRQIEGSSLLQRAKADAIRFLESLPSDHSVSILQMSSPRGATILANQRQPEDGKKTVNEVSSSQGIADLESTRSLIEELLRQLEAKHDSASSTTVRFYSDLAMNTWQAARSESFATRISSLAVKWTLVPSSTLIRNESPNAPGNRPSTGSDQSTYPNLGIRDLRLISVPQVGESTEIEVLVENFGNSQFDSVPLQILLQGRTFASRDIAFSDDTTFTVRIPWTPQQADSFQIEARLNPDALPDDNQRFLLAPVTTTSRVLIVEGESGDAKYIENALSASDTGRLRFQFTRSNLSMLQSLDLSEYETIFVSDVKFDAVDPPEAIEQYVRQGGNAIVWLGPNVDKDRYEKTWRSSNRDEIFLPFTMDKIESMNDRALDPLGYQSPVILPFRDHPESGLLTTPIEKFWQIRLDPTPSTVTHLATSSGEPLIVSSQFGQGTAFWWTTGLRPISESSPSWNVIAAWPSFVPILQEMVEYVRSQQSSQRTVLIGQPLRGHSPVAGQAFELMVTPPNQIVETTTYSSLEKAPTTTWVYYKTDQVGFYQIRSQPSEVDHVYAVNPDISESKQDFLAISEVESWLKPEMNASPAVTSPQASTTRYEQLLLAAVLLVVMAETGLAAWFGIQRR